MIWRKSFSRVVILVIAILLLVPVLSACKTSEKEPEATEEVKPSNPGGTGEAVNLTGDATAGEQIFSQQCVPCHGEQGKGGVANAGSTDTTVPPLNPIDPGLYNSDPKVFASNIDLFLEHGSTPEGTSPEKTMPAFGDQKILSSQQIADVIAYVISLNKK